MAGYLSMKMKRKYLEDMNNEFSDFPLSSPARKIRRLDAELPPIMEEEEPKVPLPFEKHVAQEEYVPGNVDQVGGSGPVIEELPDLHENEERAIVLFKPISTVMFQSPSNFSVTINPDIISGIKHQIHWCGQSNAANVSDEELIKEGSDARGRNGCLAVVPWVPSQILPMPGTKIPPTEASELMESEGTGADTMDIEENCFTADPREGCESSSGMKSLHQWQQQHCVIPPVNQKTPTPVVWFQ